jgi:multidrug efflux pump subunit AcrB
VLPQDVQVSYEFDQSPYVTRAIGGLTLEGALGAALTGLMVLLFLRDWRSALIVVINIPLSLMGGLLALKFTGQTINIMTLGGLALAVGILVDEATVCIENIHTRLLPGTPVNRAALDATVETATPRFLAMLCVLAIFSPTLFMSGAAKAMFLPLSLAVGFSMITSFLLSSTLVPILSVWVLRGHEALVSEKTLAGPAGTASRGSPAEPVSGANAAKEVSGGFMRFQQIYGAMTKKILRTRWALVPLYLVAAGAVIVLPGKRLGTEIFPRVEAGQIQVRFRAPAGTHIDSTEAVALKMLALIGEEAGTNNIATTLGFMGVHGAAYPINLIYLWNGGPEEGVLQVQLKPDAKVAIEPMKERLRAIFAERLPGVDFSFEPADIVSRVMSLGSSTPIEVVVSGQNLAADRAFAEKLKQRLQQVPSLRDLQFGQAMDYPTVEVNVDRQKAGILGVKMADVSRALVPATSSSRFVVPNYWADPNSGVAYQVQVQVPQAQMNTVEEVRNVPVLGSAGRNLPLRNVATVAESAAIGQYERYNMQRLVTLTANITGADLGGIARQIDAAVKDVGDPPTGITVTVRGQIVPLQQMIDGLRTGLLLAVLVIFLLLVANFQSIKLSLAVISTAPAVIAGVVLTLLATRTTLNIQSFMGAIMAVGVAVANAILLVTFAERARMAGAPAFEAAVEGARTRLRPILMTSFAMMAGMMPMALGLGEGGEQTAPLGRAVVGGLAAATLATLLVLPAVYAVIQSRAHRRSASLDPDETK